MRALIRLVVASLGILLFFPGVAMAQEAHLRSLAATGTVDQLKVALHSTSEITKQDSSGESALMLAAAYNHDPLVIPLLIGAGANINARNDSGETALIMAAEYNTVPEMITELLKAGADLEDRDGLGRTALMTAAWGNPNPEVTISLLKAGANAKARSYSGQSALEYAQSNERLLGTDGYRLLEKETDK